MTTRRVFIKSGAAAMLSLGFAPSFLTRDGRRGLEPEAADRDLPARRGGRPEHGRALRRGRVLPAAPVHRCRPGRAALDGALDLDGFFGLHPRLAPLLPLWTNGSLAIVHACGSPDRTRSHFDAQDYMETATPGVKSTRDGWLNRYLQGGPADPLRGAASLRGVAVTRQMPRSLQGRAPSLAFASAGAFDVRGDMASARAFEAAYSRRRDRAAAGRRAATRSTAMRTLRDRPARGGTHRPANGAEYPRSPVRTGAAGDRAHRQGRRRPRDRLRRVDQLGPPRQRRRRAGPARAAARRLRRAASPRSPPTSAIAWPTPSS